MTSKSYKEMVEIISGDTAERTAVEEAVIDELEQALPSMVPEEDLNDWYCPEGWDAAAWYFIDAERDEEDSRIWHVTALEGNLEYTVRTSKGAYWHAEIV